MASTKTYVETIRTEAVKPFFAVAGATEWAMYFAAGYASETQRTAQDRLNKVSKQVSKIDLEPKAFQKQARGVVSSTVDDLTREAKDAQDRFESRVTGLQKDARALPGKVTGQINEAVDELLESYNELADRGEKFLAAVRKDGVRVVTAVKDAPSQSTTGRRAAQKRNNGPAAKAGVKAAPSTKKSTTKKSTTKKATATKSTTAKSTTAKSTPTAKKSPAAKKSTAKKTSTSSTRSTSA